MKKLLLMCLLLTSCYKDNTKSNIPELKDQIKLLANNYFGAGIEAGIHAKMTLPNEYNLEILRKEATNFWLLYNPGDIYIKH